MSEKRGKTIAILQARMSSTRMPGKVLKSLLGKPMLLRQIERIQQCKSIDAIVVATSSDHSDDPIVQAAQEMHVPVVRGSLDDVLSRFLLALDLHPADVVVRLTADCPLISPVVIDQVVERFHDSSADYMSNTLMPTYPDGLDVEVFLPSALKSLVGLSPDSAEREHVTLGIYRRPNKFYLENYVDPSGNDNSHLRWTVDTSDDFSFVEFVYEQLFPTKRNFDLEDVLMLLAANPDRIDTHSHLPRNAALAALDNKKLRGHDSRKT